MTEDTALPCSEKLAFDNRSQAQAAAVVADLHHGTKLKTYLCSHCTLWHLASK